MIRAAAVIAAIVAPWLALLVPTGAISVGLYALAITAAFHGYGLAVARLARRTDTGAFLTVHWGIAAVVAIAGVAIAFGVYTARVQWFVVFYGAAVHSAVLAMRFRAIRDRVAASSLRFWIVPALLVAAIAVIHVIGAAGDVGARPFDDDGNLLGQIKRLLDTGGLADGIGYPRATQLGGNAALGSLAALAGDLRFVRMLDGLGLVLFLGLACARLRLDDAVSGLWAGLMIVVASSLAVVQADPSPLWLLAGLALALFASVEDATDDARTALPAALVAGALIATRTELAPVAVVGLLGAPVPWFRSVRSPGRADRSGSGARTLVVLAAAMVAAFAPYALAHHLAVSLPIASSSGWSVARVAGFLAIAIAAGALLLLPFGSDRSRAQRSAAWATAAGIAGIATQLTGERPYATHFLWPIALAYAAKLVIDLARRDRADAPLATSLIVALLATTCIYEGRDTTGRARWSHRYTELVFGIEYVHRVGDAAPGGGSYARALAAVPAGASVAVWVARPELLDYRAHRIVDLRTPRWAALRKHSDDHRLAKLVVATDADYLLVERDDAYLSRAQQDVIYYLLCTPPDDSDACADDLEIFVRDHPLVASDGLVRVIRTTKQ